MKQPIPFGKYLLLERVNVGGMAEVFKAKAFGVEGFERLVAVKRILPSIAEDEVFINMFIDEAKIAGQLSHAQIAQIFDLGRASDSYYIAMEFVHGKDLRAIFDRARKRGDSVSVPMACYAVMKICEGLDYAHNKKDASGRGLNLVHRDVSPQNIIISYDGEIKIIDFGIAKAANKASKTQAGILKGKFGYMSPEQVRGLPLDRRSDIFSAGIVLYELLTGERLFVGESDFSTLEKVRKVEIMPPSTYNRRIPEELEKIVLKALSKDPDDRYQTAMDFHDDLQSFIYTSGSFFARKDLSSYMHKTFADEIAKETARDEEYRRLSAPGGDATGLDALDELVSPRPKETIPAKAASISRGTGVPPIPKRKSTMLGAGAARPPAPPPPPPTPAPLPANDGGPHLEMDWDEDELATQIYDKPGFSGLGALGALGAGSASPSSVPPARSSSLPSPPLSSWDSPEPARNSALEGAPSPFDLGPPSEERESDTVRPAAPSLPEEELQVRGLDAGLSAPAKVPSSAPRAPGKEPYKMWLGVGVAALVTLGALVALFAPSKPGYVNLDVRPRTASVTVDGVPLQGASFPRQLELTADEPHTVVVSADGYEDWTQTVRVAAEQTRSLPLVELARASEEPGRAVAVAGTGFTLDTQPSGAQVYVDDNLVDGRTPITINDLEPGRHNIRVEMGERYAPWRTQISIQDGEMLALPAAILSLRSVEVSFRSNPSGARITVERGSERRSLGRTPHTETLDITGGTWTVRMSRADHRDWSQALEVTGEEAALTVNARLEEVEVAAAAPSAPSTASTTGTASTTRRRTPAATPTPAVPRPNPTPAAATPVRPAPAPAAAGPGTLLVNTTPWSMVTVDGRYVGNTPQRAISLRPGRHQVRLRNPDFNINVQRTVTIRAGETTRLILSLTP